MEPADQIPRPRNRPSHNQNLPPTLGDNNFLITEYIQTCDAETDFLKPKIIKISDDVDLISNGFEVVGQQYVRMRDIRWRKSRARSQWSFNKTHRDMNLLNLCTAMVGCDFCCRYQTGVMSRKTSDLLARIRKIGAHPCLTWRGALLLVGSMTITTLWVDLLKRNTQIVKGCFCCPLSK